MAAIVLLALIGFITISLTIWALERARDAKEVAAAAQAELAELQNNAAMPLTSNATLVLQLPEPARSKAWQILCNIVDGQQQLINSRSHSRSQHLLTQTSETYLPETLQTYLALNGAARDRLKANGQDAEELLLEQLNVIHDGVEQAIKHEHTAADRLLTQGHFLRERFATSNEFDLLREKKK